jgi:hypothetical protein
MPKWLKIVLGVAGVVSILVLAAGIFGVVALMRALDDVKETSEAARGEGAAFGGTVTLERCVQETVNRSAECAALNLACAPPLSAFLWSCIRAAPYDAPFCDGMPPLVDERVMLRWGRRTCKRYGERHNEVCAMALASITGFCEAAAAGRPVRLEGGRT